MHLAHQRKGHRLKVRLAQQLRTQTTLTVGQIAARLQTRQAGELGFELTKKPAA
jgi:hypothetical protein